MTLFQVSTAAMPAVSLAGKVYVPAPNEHFPRTPREYILYYIRKGCMQLEEGEVLYNLTAGDLLLLDPSRSHVGRPTPFAVDYYYIHFNWEGMFEYREQDSLSALLLHNKLSEEPHDILYLPKYVKLQEQDRSLMEQAIVSCIGLSSSRQDYHRMRSSCAFLSVIELALRSFIIQDASLPQEDANQGIVNRSASVSDLITYLQSNYRNAISSEDIEAAFHMNFDYLNRIFKKATGTTMIAYHNRYRINEAKKLLESGAYTVKQVASLLGFANEFYFSRVYKQQEGVAPGRRQSVSS